MQTTAYALSWENANASHLFRRRGGEARQPPYRLSEHGPARAEIFPIEANISLSLATSPLNGGTIGLARQRLLDSTPALQRKRSPTCRVPPTSTLEFLVHVFWQRRA